MIKPPPGYFGGNNMHNENMGSKKADSFRWNLRPLFASDDDPGIERERKRVRREARRFIGRWRERTDYLKDPRVLRLALDDYERWRRLSGPDGSAGYYIWLRTQQDQNAPDLKARYNLMEEFSKGIENEMQFFYLRLAKVGPERQRVFLADAGLRRYRHFLGRIFAESRHLLSEPEERILNLKAPMANGNWVRMTSGLLAKEERRLKSGGGRLKTFSELGSLMNDGRKKVRDEAAGRFNEILSGHVEVAEAELNSVLQDKKVDDELRRFSRPDESRHIGDDIDTAVVDRLLDAVAGRFDISRRYYRLKAGVMGLRRLGYHERNVEYGKVGRRYTYASACRLVEKVMSGLDPDFASIFRRFIQNGQIDVFPEKGKAGGAFCVHHLIGHPTYILLNHTNTIHDVLTLAHELGHGINNELMKARLHALDFGATVCTAEVASTFMEDFVLQEILGRADEETRLAVMMMKLNDDVSTIFRQVACYRFEQELHADFRRKGYLSKEEIGALFAKHMKAYMGDAVEQSAGSQNWWVYWSHIRSFFYVYSYASGLLISKALQRAVREDAGFIGKVKEFLSAGLSDSPERIFKRLGITIRDRAFWESGLDEVDRLLRDTQRLARRMGKLK